MVRSFLVQLGVVVSGLCLAACGSSSSASKEDACKSYAEAYCARLESCASAVLKVLYGDAQTCATRIAPDCVGALNAPGNSTQPARAIECATALGNASCPDLVDGVLPEACQEPPGALADGTVCGTDGQCAGAYCRRDTGGICGVCSARVGGGSACKKDADCTRGLLCANSVCITPGGAGALCDATHPCERQFVCTGKACRAPAAAGAPCDVLKAECDTVAGLYCDGKAKVCRTAVLSAAGQRCGASDSGEFAVCTAGASCPGATGTCVAPAADGAACNDTKGPHCLSPARCLNTTCTRSDISTCK